MYSTVCIFKSNVTLFASRLIFGRQNTYLSLSVSEENYQCYDIPYRKCVH